MHPFDHPTTQAVARIIDENNLLIGGAARQAALIRDRGERISQLEAQLTEAQYQLELVKAQGRKTRSKVRGLKKALSDSQNHLGQALGRAERAEAACAPLFVSWVPSSVLRGPRDTLFDRF